MGYFKDLYIQELEREWADLEAQGVPSDKAYELAGQRAYKGLRETLAKRADSLRKKEKGE